MTPTKISFEKRYSDGSGVEIGIHYDQNSSWEITIESGSSSISVGKDFLPFIRSAIADIEKLMEEE